MAGEEKYFGWPVEPAATIDENDFYSLIGWYPLVEEGETSPVTSSEIEELLCTFEDISPVNEGSTRTLEFSFATISGASTTPTAIEYRIDDVGSEVEILDDTSIVPPLADVRVLITGNDNRILDSDNVYEWHCVTVTWTYGVTVGHEEYKYKVRNLIGVR